MLTAAFLIGIYSYLLLLLGLFGWLAFLPVFITSLLFGALFLSLIFKQRSGIILLFRSATTSLEKALIAVFIALGAVNLTGALGPELAFDALWYHLTIPKLFVERQTVYFITDPLFYYSLMPKLTEMLYAVSLILWDERGAKLIHFGFGLLTVIATYKLSRLYLQRKYSLLVALIFYANPVVSWLSITAYSDLSRAFFETLSLYYFLIYSKKKLLKPLILSSLMLGFAICTKLISLGTIPIFLFLILLLEKAKKNLALRRALLYLTLNVSVALPWFVIAFFHTGNPFYPLFSHLGLRGSYELFFPTTFIKVLIDTFLFAPDPILPFYLIVLPIAIIKVKSLIKKYKLILIYSVASYLVWYFTSQSGGSRFLTSYLPAYTLLCVLALFQLRNKFIQNVTFVIIIALALITLLYRGIANFKYLPFILGFESKETFLMKELNFSFGDFYDEGGKIKKIVKNDAVLLINMHNLYYVDFPFVLSEKDKRWSGKYILIQDGVLPDKFKKAKAIYTNARTKATLYKL